MAIGETARVVLRHERRQGILCFCCNNALADFQENPALLGKAAGYLSHHAHKDEVELARQRALSLVGR